MEQEGQGAAATVALPKVLSTHDALLKEPSSSFSFSSFSSLFHMDKLKLRLHVFENSHGRKSSITKWM